MNPKEIKVTMEEAPANRMFLHEEIASGKYGEDKYRLSRIVPTSSFLIEFKGKRHVVQTQELAKAMLENL